MPLTGVVPIPSTASNYSVYGVNAITLDLDADLLYYVTGIELVSYNIGEGDETESYPHESANFPANASSLASYNDYLAFPVTLGSTPIIAFVKIRDLDTDDGQADVTLVSIENPAKQVYMIREELQPIPGILLYYWCLCSIIQFIATAPPGPVDMVKYFSGTDFVNFTWIVPRYGGSGFGMS